MRAKQISTSNLLEMIKQGTKEVMAENRKVLDKFRALLDEQGYMTSIIHGGNNVIRAEFFFEHKLHKDILDFEVDKNDEQGSMKKFIDLLVHHQTELKNNTTKLNMHANCASDKFAYAVKTAIYMAQLDMIDYIKKMRHLILTNELKMI